MILSALLLGLLLFLCGNTAEALDPKKLDPKKLAEAIKKTEQHILLHLDRKQIPGCAVAVVYQNQIIFMNGYGVRSFGKTDKIDLDTVFQLGSVSKPIAATLTTLLENQGLLSVEDPVSNYLPNFALNNKQPPKALKIKNLLSHTSGLPRNGFNHLIETFTPYPEIMKALQKPRISVLPGRRYDYHNAMYGLIAEVTKAATYQSFPDALQSKLLKPLKMNNTSATFTDLFCNANRASPHTKGRRGTLCPCEPYSQGYYTVAPAGGINSSVRDMAIFLKAQMGGHPEVVPHKVLAKMQTPVIPTKNMIGSARSKNPHYGLGWRIVEYADQKLVYHGGWVKGFTNFLAFMPDQQLGIVILHNADTKFSSKAAMKFFDAALGLPDEPLIKQGHKMKKKKAMKAKAKAGKIKIKPKAKKRKAKIV